jgi:hypothetical protein
MQKSLVASISGTAAATTAAGAKAATAKPKKKSKVAEAEAAAKAEADEAGEAVLEVAEKHKSSRAVKKTPGGQGKAAVPQRVVFSEALRNPLPAGYKGPLSKVMWFKGSVSTALPTASDMPMLIRSCHGMWPVSARCSRRQASLISLPASLLTCPQWPVTSAP